MHQRPGQRIEAAAFRARRFPACSRQPIRIKNGPFLPADALPTPPIPTDSAAAPRPRERPLDRLSRQPSALPPDPDYERRLEALAEAMLGAHQQQSLQAPNEPAQDQQTIKPVPPAPVAAVAPAKAAPAEAAPSRAPAVASRPAKPAAARSSRMRDAESEPVPAPSVHQRAKATPAGQPTPRERAHSPPVMPPRRGARNRSVSEPRVATLENADRHGRIEPELTPGQSRSSRHPPPSSSAQGTGMIAMSLFAGLAIGVGAAVWLSQVEDLEPSNAPSTGIAAGASAVTYGDTASEESGESLATTGSSDVAAGALPTIVTPPVRASSSASASATGDNTAGKPDAQEPVAQAAPPPAPADKAGTGKRASAPPKQASADSQRKRTPSKTAVRGATTAGKSARERAEEITRLKSQAYSESSRDRTRRGAPPASKPGAGVKPVSTASDRRLAATTRNALERCEDMDGLFRRERCKWDVCGGRWGQNGCPSYPKREPLF